MKEVLKRFIREEEGQDLIEYTLLAALISVASYTIINSVGGSVRTVFTSVNTQLTTAGS